MAKIDYGLYEAFDFSYYTAQSYLLFSVPPVCSPKGVKVYGVAKRETAHIACKVEANPPKVSFR